MQCGKKICRHGHYEVIVSLTSHEQKEAISPTGAVEQMRQFRRPPDQCSLYGARKASRCDLKGPKFRKVSALRADGRQLHSLCIDILACRDETIRAITVIRLNLNPLSKILDPPLTWSDRLCLWWIQQGESHSHRLYSHSCIHKSKTLISSFQYFVCSIAQISGH